MQFHRVMILPKITTVDNFSNIWAVDQVFILSFSKYYYSVLFITWIECSYLGRFLFAHIFGHNSK